MTFTSQWRYWQNRERTMCWSRLINNWIRNSSSQYKTIDVASTRIFQFRRTISSNWSREERVVLKHFPSFDESFATLSNNLDRRRSWRMKFTFSLFSVQLANRIAMEKYMIISPIGEGSFAKVYRGREKFTGRVRIPFRMNGKRNRSRCCRMWRWSLFPN